MTDRGPERALGGHLGAIQQTSFSFVNVGVLLFVGALGIGLLYAEGYLSLLDWPFLLYVVAVTLGGLWFGAFELSRKRLLFMVLVAELSGYLTQVVGSDVEGVWRYEGPRGTYYFVCTMFAFAAVFAYGLTALVIGPWVRKHLRYRPRWLNVIVVAGVFAVLAFGSHPYRGHGEPAFWIYYGALGLFAAYASLLMDLGTLVTLVAVAMGIGIVSETLGASSGVWQFTGMRPWLPPAYLVFGSWPLEIILHYGLSGILARERLIARPRFFEENKLFEAKTDHPMWTGDRPHKVASVKNADKLLALDEVLRRTGFFEVLSRREKETSKDKASLDIVIKPNLMFMYSVDDKSTFTDPELVEHLVERIWAAGYRRIKVVEAQSAYGNFFLRPRGR